jgi:hypothetical protein
MKTFFTFLLSFCFVGLSLGQVNWYIGPNGTNTPTSGASPLTPFATFSYACNYLTPGDTLFALGGTYQNSDYNDNDIWTGEPAARIEVNGAPGAYITFKPYQNQKPLIDFDGNYGILIQTSSYVRVTGFELRGIGWDIDITEAYGAWGTYKTAAGVVMDLAVQMGITPNDPALLGQELPKPATPNIEKPVLYNGRGIVANSSHHIEIIGNVVHDVPSSAIRVQQSDWVTVSENEVYHNTYWTSLGVGAIAVAEATNSDNTTGIKIRIENNHVHHNENRLISWAPDKLIVKFVIDEGTGIFMTRNRDTYQYGQIAIFNNLSYLNGASGITCHFTRRAIIEHNTVYLNGQTNTGTAGGISLNNADTVTVRNNISWSKSNKHALGWLSQPGIAITIAANLVFNGNGVSVTNNITSGWTAADPLFMNVAGGNFYLKNNSPALGLAVANFAPINDFYGVLRPTNADLGAVEHNIGQCTPCIKLNAKAYLQGGFNTTTGLMNDNLRAANLLPTTDPYSTLGFAHVGGGGSESAPATVFAVTGNNAIVDWIFLELRDKTNPANVLYTKSALIQKDGDIVETDGVSVVYFPTAPSGDYFVAVKHRNHLGVRTPAVVSLSRTAAAYDFTTSLSKAYQNTAITSNSAMSSLVSTTVYGLSRGNANGDNYINILDAALGKNQSSPNQTSVYRSTDVNLDGNVTGTDAAVTKNQSTPHKTAHL